MVIKSNTLTELRKNAAYSRQYAAALIAHAERIEALIEAEAAVADVGASQTEAEPARTEAPAENSLAAAAPVEPPRVEAVVPVEPPHAEPPRVEPEAEPAREEAPAEAPRVNAPSAPFTRLELPRPNREAGVTQVEAIQTALRVLGRPASLGEIFTTIKSQRIPVKLTSAENLRFVMRANEDFETNDAGQWQLKATQPTPDYTDRASALTAPEGVEVASTTQG